MEGERFDPIRIAGPSKKEIFSIKITLSNDWQKNELTLIGGDGRQEGVLRLGGARLVEGRHPQLVLAARLKVAQQNQLLVG